MHIYDKFRCIYFLAYNLQARMICMQHWAQVISNEGGLKFWGVHACLPTSSELGLILRGHTPKIDTMLFIRRDESREVLCPGALVR